MEDDLAALDRVVGPLVALDVALDHLDRVAHLVEIGPGTGGEVVENPDLVPVPEQAGHEM